LAVLGLLDAKPKSHAVVAAALPGTFQSSYIEDQHWVAAHNGAEDTLEQPSSAAIVLTMKLTRVVRKLLA
jgi:hypothetical protein